MLLAWHNVFQRATASDSRFPDPGAQEKALQNLRRDTLVSQIGLSTRAQNTLDRLSILTAQELAAQPPGKFSNLRGVGNKKRREIMDLVGKLRSKLPQSAIPDRSAIEIPTSPSDEQPTAPLSLDALTALLVPVATSASGKVSRQTLAQFLEPDDSISGAAKYPTQAQIADSTGKARAQISQAHLLHQ
jgi:Bacterial RNA polymerase, alpha chain C terminal domain